MILSSVYMNTRNLSICFVLVTCCNETFSPLPLMNHTFSSDLVHISQKRFSGRVMLWLCVCSLVISEFPLHSNYNIYLGTLSCWSLDRISTMVNSRYYCFACSRIEVDFVAEHWNLISKPRFHSNRVFAIVFCSHIMLVSVLQDYKHRIISSNNIGRKLVA